MVARVKKTVCKSDRVQLISKTEVYNTLYEAYKNELKCKYGIIDDKASRKANIYAVKNTNRFYNKQHMLS